jgi:hypothetical protein
LGGPEEKSFTFLSNSEPTAAVEGRRRGMGVSSIPERETTQIMVKAPKCRLSVSKGVLGLRHREG